jgi:hypothetical protein
MGTWYLGPRENKDIYAALDVIKCDPIECDDEGKDRMIAYLSERDRWKPPAEAIENEAIWFDGGGAIISGEPCVAWEANGCRMKTYVRHLPFLLDTFKSLKTHDELKGMLVMGGFCRLYVIGTRTRDESIETMERLVRGTESLRQETEMSLQNCMNKSPNAASLRKCGCMSGKLYVECCGKYVESQKHKENREAIQS